MHDVMHHEQRNYDHVASLIVVSLKLIVLLNPL